MSNRYEEPMMEVIEFEAEDVIVTSGNNGDNIVDTPDIPAP